MFITMPSKQVITTHDEPNKSSSHDYASFICDSFQYCLSTYAYIT
jgi:hypothetical protein